MLDPKDRQILEAYRRVMARVRETRMVREPASYSVHFGSPDRSAAELPDEDAFRALAIVFRPLWANDEPATFTKAVQALYRAVLTDDERKLLDDARKHWKETCKSSRIKINLGSKPLTPRAYIDMYLYGLYFHEDDDKRGPREGLEAAIGEATSRAFLMDWLRELIDAAACIEQIVANVLDRDSTPAIQTPTQ